MSEDDPFELAQRREREADELAARGDRLEEEVRRTREDWKRKRADDDVPGAPPADDDVPGAPAAGDDAPDAPAQPDPGEDS